MVKAPGGFWVPDEVQFKGISLCFEGVRVPFCGWVGVVCAAEWRTLPGSVINVGQRQRLSEEMAVSVEITGLNFAARDAS